MNNFRGTLKNYLSEFDDLSGEYNSLETQLEAIRREFLYERRSGKKGDLPSIPTLQDFAIYSFWISYVVLFYMLGIHSSILTGIPRYVFIGGTVAAFLSSYFFTIAPGIILFLTLMYFLSQGYKTGLFFFTFLAITVVIHMAIGTLM